MTRPSLHLGDEAREVHHLPSIPALAPIQMPSPRSFLFDDHHLEPSENSATGISYTSEDSFTTAFTSAITPLSPPSTAGHTVVPTDSEPRPHLSPRSLRKSMSVDSFVQHVPGESFVPSMNSPDWSADDDMRDSIIDPDLDHWRFKSQLPPSTSVSNQGEPWRDHTGRRRTRGIALNIMEDELDDSPHEFSDVDRHYPLEARRSTHRSPRPRAPAPVPAGGLSLAGRLTGSQTEPSQGNAGWGVPFKKPNPTSSASTSHGKSSASVSSAAFAKSHRVPTRKVSEPTINAARRNHTITINTGNLQPQGIPEFTIAVVGPTSSGKTMFIRKSLKMHSLTDPVHRTAVVGTGASSRTMPYIFRTARMKAAQSERFIKVLELDSKHFLPAEPDGFLDAWPSGLPRIDGVFVCYDASNVGSLEHVGKFLRGYHLVKIPSIVLACKSDVPSRVPPKNALSIVSHYAGIVEVDIRTDDGKHKMRKSIDVLFRAIIKFEGRVWKDGENYHNPASPDVVSSPNTPWDIEASDAGNFTISSSISTMQPPADPLSFVAQASSSSSVGVPSVPAPSRVRSASDLASERQKLLASQDYHPTEERSKSQSNINLPEAVDKVAVPQLVTDPEPEDADFINGEFTDKQEDIIQEPSFSPWVTVEQLVDKLFFVAISGDDSAFIKHFFLTYRRFTTPRSVLLGMQKRMIELNGPCSDPMLAAFAQMRTCNLLETWMKEYPGDFAVAGAAGALSAFTKQTLAHSHTLHYGSDFLPFLEILPTLTDEDCSWALKPDDICIESDEGEGFEPEETYEPPPKPPSLEQDEVDSFESERQLTGGLELELQVVDAPLSSARERKSSLPLSAKSFLQTPPSAGANGRQRSQSSSKDILARLLRTAQQVLHVDSADIAREITRIDWNNFSKIEPRHWLRHTLVSGKKNPETDPIARFHEFFNHLHNWALSLILCHDKAKARARQIEKFAEIASVLRALNNYSSLRAIVTAISASTFPGDLPMEIFRTKGELYKRYRSSDVLLHSTGAHRSYRLALRNTKRGCIPCLEVHMSDLFRAHEGNPDFKEEDPTKIHWAKFNMIGKFVSSTAQYQTQCHVSGDYNLPENPGVSDLLRTRPMDYELQQTRMTPPPDLDGMDNHSPSAPMMPLSANSQSKESGIRRLFMW